MHRFYYKIHNMITLDFASTTFLLAATCSILCIIQLCYVFGIYNRIHQLFKKGNEPSATDLPPLSVIIVTKDSGSALNQNLPAILEQDYPKFEVIVINDKSAGEDEDILKLLSDRYENLYHTFIPKTARYVSRKKLGIAMGIRASRYDWIVVTEPYCHPVSKNWLRSLAAQMTPSTDIVLGYSNYLPKKGWFARRIITDSFFHSLRYLGMALAGHPYMGVGCNLAYRKSLYEKHKGFADHLQLQRGEDDLFINAVANKYNTRVASGPDSIVRMPVPPYKRIWFERKMNALVTGHYYRGMARISNAFETWTCGLFHLTTIGVLAMSIAEQQWIVTGIVALLWLLRFISVMMVFRRTAHDLNENLCCIFPLFDLLRPLWSLVRQTQYLLRKKRDFLRK